MAGAPDHDPLEAVSVWPWEAVPVIDGGTVLAGGDMAGTTAVGPR